MISRDLKVQCKYHKPLTQQKQQQQQQQQKAESPF